VAALARALGAAEPARALREIGLLVDVPHSLGELGLGPADLDTVAARVEEAPYPNLRPAGRAEVRALLDAAWRGAPL
jgi:maleylacetate reductase